MNLMLNASDISRLSPSARAELAALFFPKVEGNLPEGFTEDDFENVLDLTPGQVEEFMEGCADVTKAGLRLIAENGPSVHAGVLDQAGITNYGSFQGATTKRVRTVTRDRNGFLFAWNDWQEEPEGIGSYAVTPATHRSLRIYFELD